jgi:hypothetical protein
MIGLVESFGEAFSISDIGSVVRVERQPRSAEHHVIKRTSGEVSGRLYGLDYDDLLGRPVQLVSAETGTSLLIVFVSDDDAFAVRIPVLAWALCMDGQVRPILPSGVRRRYSESTADWHPDYVEMPDGSIYEFGFEADTDRYDSVDEVLAIETNRKARYDLDRDAKAAAAQVQS